MFQPNVASWQQQQHHQPQLQQQQQQQQSQQHHQVQHPQHVQPQYPQQNITTTPQVDGKWNNQPGISATVEQQQQQQQIPFQPFGYNTVGNQPFLNNYVNYEHQQQVQPPPPTLPQQQQQISNTNNFQTHQDHQSLLTQSFFDNNQNNNNNNNNNNGKGDEWGDWGDWNENNNNNMENNNQLKTQQLQQQQQNVFNPQTQLQQQPQILNASNVINESFTASDNNWNWNINMNTEQPVNTTTIIATNLPSSTVLPSPPAMQAKQQQVPRHISNFQQPPAQILDKTNENTLQHIMTQENNAENLASLSKQNLPITATTTTTTNNIPNTVFVTQAKPVTMPSRQYASTPSEISSSNNVEQIIAPPPEGFQNEPPKVVAPPMAPPISAGFGLPPPAAVVTNSNVNPFKRAGAPQHHVANFITTAQNPNSEQSAFLPITSNEAATELVFEQPDNSEVLHENQEVVNQSFAAIQQQKQHLNDERNQYMQTSHLSENAMEENIEIDNFPPPGLSRLVLGEPELEANQRQVTGTEDTLPDLVGNMRLDERQADGEDNTTNNIVPGKIKSNRIHIHI